MAITDLTNTKWRFKDRPAYISGQVYISINFKSNNNTYTQLFVSPFSPASLSYNNDAVYNSSNEPTWVDNAYKTIEITGGDDATDSDFITWLQQNATQILPPDSKSLVTYEDLEIFKNKMVSLILKYKCGYYDPSIMYNVGDSVFYNKQIYVCISNTLGDVPPTNTTYWTPLVVNDTSTSNSSSSLPSEPSDGDVEPDPALPSR